MILSNVNIGTGPSAGNGDPLRSAFNIINTNFQIVKNNVSALTNSVTTVAGRTGNVTLTVNDVIGAASKAYVDSQYANITLGNVNLEHVEILGDAVTGELALTVGLVNGLTNFGNTIANFHGNLNSLALVSVHNINSGPQAGSGFLAVADDGDETQKNAFFGIANSTWGNPNTLFKPHDSVLLAYNGNLVLMSGAYGPEKNIVFGTDYNLEFARFSPTSTTAGNLVLGSNIGIVFGDTTVQSTAWTGFTANSANWSNPAPTTLNDAIDRLAILLKTLNSGTGA